ncbi:MAG: DUF4199 domain-containing protein [Sphingobacteriaceae bacterium]
MNKKALIIALIYSVLVIIYKLSIWLGGNMFNDFNFKYSHILTVLSIIPFLIVTIKWVRDKDNGGVISGRDAMRMALTVVGISAIILSIYNYVEFKMNMDAFAEYYRSETYMNYMMKDPKAKQLGYQKIIDFQISQLSPIKATTGKLFPFLLLSLSGSFICAVFMKKNPA